MDFAVTASLTDLLFDDAYDGTIDPLELFPHWLEEARETEPNDPNAMAVASVDQNGMPDLRMVLLNGYSHEGFVFFTNFESAKGRQLLAHRNALVERVEALTEQFADGEIGRPAHWSGFRIQPLEIEFWKDGAFRLHDRVLFTRPDLSTGWSRTRLYP